MIIICLAGLRCTKQTQNNENVRGIWNMCELLHLMETEHSIKTAKHTTHGKMIACWPHCFVLYYFLRCYHKLYHRHWNLLNYRRELELNLSAMLNESRTQQKAKKRHFDAFIFARNGISIYGLWSQAFYAYFFSSFRATRD